MARREKKEVVAEAPVNAPEVQEQGAVATEAEEPKKLLAADDFQYLLLRAAKIAKLVLGSLGNTVRVEEEGGVPEAERLTRNVDGTVARIEIDRLVESWEKSHGGEGSATNLLTKEAHDHYMQKQLFDVLRYKELAEIVRRSWGITLEELEAAVETKKAENVAYRERQDLRNDGPEVLCVRDSEAGIERKFQPTSSFIVVNGERLTDRKSGRPIRTGNFRVRRDRKTNVPELMAVCPSCKRELREKARAAGAKIYFEPREDAEARLELIQRGIEHGQKKDTFDEDLFREERERRERRGGRRNVWGQNDRSGDLASTSARDKRRGGGNYGGRFADKDGGEE